MKRPALWRYLWRWTLAALAVAWATLLVASYYAGLHEAQEINPDAQVGEYIEEPMEGLEVVFIHEDGAVIEFMEWSK